MPMASSRSSALKAPSLLHRAFGAFLVCFAIKSDPQILWSGFVTSIMWEIVCPLWTSIDPSKREVMLTERPVSMGGGFYVV